MATNMSHMTAFPLTAERANPIYQGYQILHVAFTVAPILAGIDKFLHLLCNWDQ